MLELPSCSLTPPAFQPGSLVAEKVSWPVVPLNLGLETRRSAERETPWLGQDWQSPDRTALGRPRTVKKSCRGERKGARGERSQGKKNLSKFTFQLQGHQDRTR